MGGALELCDLGSILHFCFHKQCFYFLLSKDVPWVWDHPWNLMYFSWLDVTYHQTKEMVPGFISTVVESISMTIIRQLIMLNLALATPWCWWHYFLD
jgi:hypothetical protein